MTRLLRPLSLIALGFALCAPRLRADHFNAAYIKGADGVWEHDGFWTTSASPNNGHFITNSQGHPVPGPNPDYDVLVSVSTPCTLGIGVTIQELNVTSDGTLNLKNNASITAKTGVGIAGRVTLNSITGGSHIRVGQALNGDTS